MASWLFWIVPHVPFGFFQHVVATFQKFFHCVRNSRVHSGNGDYVTPLDKLHPQMLRSAIFAGELHKPMEDEDKYVYNNGFIYDSNNIH